MNVRRIIVEEWANDHKISLTEYQINDLLDALSVSAELENYRLRDVQSKSESQIEIEKLKRQIEMMEYFIYKKL